MTGRVVAFAPLHLPHRGIFVAPWGRPWSDRATLTATLASVAQLRASLFPARLVAVVAGLLLFVAGPVLTIALGPDAAVLDVAAVVYPTVLAGIVTLWWRRGALRLTPRRALLLSAEILVCPAFLPNLVRKITAAEPIEVDGAQIVAATASPAVKQDFFARLERRTEDLIDEAGSDERGQEQLRTYLTTVREAQ
jgi:hypothetical protein